MWFCVEIANIRRNSSRRASGDGVVLKDLSLNKMRIER